MPGRAHLLLHVFSKDDVCLAGMQSGFKNRKLPIAVRIWPRPGAWIFLHRVKTNRMHTDIQHQLTCYGPYNQRGRTNRKGFCPSRFVPVAEVRKSGNSRLNLLIWTLFSATTYYFTGGSNLRCHCRAAKSPQDACPKEMQASLGGRSMCRRGISPFCRKRRESSTAKVLFCMQPPESPTWRMPRSAAAAAARSASPRARDA